MIDWARKTKLNLFEGPRTVGKRKQNRPFFRPQDRGKLEGVHDRLDKYWYIFLNSRQLLIMMKWNMSGLFMPIREGIALLGRGESSCVQFVFLHGKFVKIILKWSSVRNIFNLKRTLLE